VDPVGQDRMLRMAEGLVANAAAGDRHRGFESVILSWEAVYPETGGIYFDAESESVVVVLTDLSREAEVVAAVRQVLGGGLLFGRDGMQVSGEIAFTSRRGDYAFSNLVAWKEILTPLLLAVPGWVHVDADERLNRVRIGIAAGTDRAEIDIAAASAGVPMDALHVEEVPPVTRLGTLRDRFRPAGGGLQIAIASETPCTYGWSVRTGEDDWGFLTAAHCAPTPGQTGSPTYQPEAIPADLLGTVAINPPWNVTGCGQGNPPCHHADVLFVSASSTSSITQRVAFTNDYQFGTNLPGDLDIAGWYDQVVDPDPPPMMVGMGVRKVGRTTGYTGGTRTGTCVNVQLGGVITLCANQVEDASVGGGDSGAPVFGLARVPPPLGPIHIVPFGVFFGGGPVDHIDPDGHEICTVPIEPPYTTCTFYYSPAAQIELHLQTTLAYTGGPPVSPEVAIVGPTLIDCPGTPQWEAIPSGFDGPYSYQWAVEYEDTGAYVTLGNGSQQQLAVGVGDGHFWMHVEVTSTSGDAEKWLYVLNETASCPW